DPNSYGGLLWCLGLFDRPFTPPKLIVGTVRPRSIQAHAERLDLVQYAAHVSRPVHPDDPEVAIVGGGISGLAAARALSDHNIRVTVFDRGRTPGGRASTRVTGRQSFDHGAQYFTARDERFQRYVSSWVKDGIAARWQARVGVAKHGAIEGKESAVARLVGVPGMNAIARHLAADIHVESGVKVTRPRRVGSRWQLVDDRQTELGEFDIVIVATPPQQAAALIADRSTLAEVLTRVRMRPCWAVMVGFEQPLLIDYDALFVHDSPVGWAARNSSKPQRPDGESWVLHATPEWSDHRRDSTAEEVSKPLLKAFLEATGVDAGSVASIDAHRWLYSQAAEPLDVGCLWDAGNSIGICGDWCSGSRIEGAFLSGMAMAGRVLSHRLSRHGL
ncbi:MAG: FAD-dependent oxidoreductase, partial [Rhodothermales bacterium]|nr:FAD-dependent oxidoreductase [Rhodothermales bacterium]